jgi:hypothetical protein
MAVETYYLLAINEDGTFTSHVDIPEELPERKRVATTWDVYSSSKQLVEEFDRQVLTDRIIDGISRLMAPPPTVSSQIKDALKERGIDPESVSIN